MCIKHDANIPYSTVLYRRMSVVNLWSYLYATCRLSKMSKERIHCMLSSRTVETFWSGWNYSHFKFVQIYFNFISNLISNFMSFRVILILVRSRRSRLPTQGRGQIPTSSFKMQEPRTIQNPYKVISGDSFLSSMPICTAQWWTVRRFLKHVITTLPFMEHLFQLGQKPFFASFGIWQIWNSIRLQ